VAEEDFAVGVRLDEDALCALSWEADDGLDESPHGSSPVRISVGERVTVGASTVPLTSTSTTDAAALGAMTSPLEPGIPFATSPENPWGPSPNETFNRLIPK